MMPAAVPPGYSGTPLAKKLGIKEHLSVLTIGAPPEYAQWIGVLPNGARLEAADRHPPASSPDIVHLFTTDRAVLETELARLRGALRSDAAVWVSWPKRAAKVPTNVTEDVIRAVALPMGWVDIKVCAVSDVWSGLKLVVRKELRT